MLCFRSVVEEAAQGLGAWGRVRICGGVAGGEGSQDTATGVWHVKGSHRPLGTAARFLLRDSGCSENCRDNVFVTPH